MKKWEGGGKVPNDDDGWMEKWMDEEVHGSRLGTL
jgi:hypothetical protein